jgi:hypothetical protein
MFIGGPKAAGWELEQIGVKANFVGSYLANGVENGVGKVQTELLMEFS